MTALTQSQRWRISGWWLVTRLVAFTAGAAANLALLGGLDGWRAYPSIWLQWDATWFASIAESGYGNPDLTGFNGVQDDYQYNGAFFPGVPMLMRLGLAFGLTPSLTGLVVSLVASLIAAFALGRLTEQVGGRADWGVAAWFVTPTAVFLAAPYTEALFAAFAFWAWVRARDGAWMAAGILAGLAAIVRSNALFLAVALFVMFVMSRERTSWWRAWPLAIPFLVVLGYFAYLRSITGQWTTWFDIQRVRWDRQFTDPWTSLRNTWDLIWTFTGTGQPSSRFVTEIIAMAMLLAVVVVLAKRREWPEFAYTALTAVSLGTSTWYYSLPRTLVVVFPLWTLLGLWLTRHRRLRWLYVALGIGLLGLVSALFTGGQWIS